MHKKVLMHTKMHTSATMYRDESVRKDRHAVFPQTVSLEWPIRKKYGELSVSPFMHMERLEGTIPKGSNTSKSLYHSFELKLRH